MELSEEGERGGLLREVLRIMHEHQQR
jgi:hypothetical protein